MASCSTTSTTLFSSTPKDFLFYQPHLSNPNHSFNGLCKPLKSQPSRSISLTSYSHSRCNSSFVVKTSMSICHFYPISCTFSLSNKLSLLVQALWSSWFKPLPPHLTTETPNRRLNMDDATDGQKTRSFIFSIQALDVWFVVSLTHHLYLSL